MNELRELELLQNVQKVKAPSHIYSHVQSRIQEVQYDHMPIAWSYALAASVALLLTLSIGLMSADGSTMDNEGLQAIASDMNLNSSNQFYDD